MGETMILSGAVPRAHRNARTKDEIAKAVTTVKGDSLSAVAPSSPAELKSRQSSLLSTASTTSVSTASSSSTSTSVVRPAVTSLAEAIPATMGKALESLTAASDKTIDPLSAAGTPAMALFNNPDGVRPSISLPMYLRRILRYIEDEAAAPETWEALSAGTCALFSALIYVDRIAAKQQQSGFRVTSLNVHRLLAVGIVIALKSQEDFIVHMPFFAALAGITLKELLQLESAFVDLVEWDVVIAKSEFDLRVNTWRKFVEKDRRKAAATLPSKC